MRFPIWFAIWNWRFTDSVISEHCGQSIWFNGMHFPLPRFVIIEAHDTCLPHRCNFWQAPTTTKSFFKNPLWIKTWPKNFQREIVGVCPLSGKGSFWRLFQTKVYKWCSSHLPWTNVVVEMHLWTTFFRENCFNITYIFPFSFIAHHTDRMKKSWEKACVCLVLVIKSGCMWHRPPGLAIRSSIPSSGPLHSLYSFGTSWWLTTAITEPLLWISCWLLNSTKPCCYSFLAFT